MKQILFITVGGSHQPIVSALNNLKPDYVVFICTGKDSATGRSGSDMQIIGKNNCIFANQNDEKPTLPNIPTQVNLTPEQYEIVLTQADDLDQIYFDCYEAIKANIEKFPNATIAADYTGGTKSMSAALAMAALEFTNVNLQLVMGSRADLIKVKDGSQFSAQASSEQIRFQRKIAPYKQAWTRFAYSEALAGLNQLKVPTHSDIRAQFIKFRELSRAFAQWDNFDHQTAYDILQQYAATLPKEWSYLSIAKSLNHEDLIKRSAAQLFDLYLNAQRRAAQGRYDDAVARVYRLIEWTAQWLLKTKAGINTSDISSQQITDSVSLSQNREGKWQAGLFQAWQLVKYETKGAASVFITEHEATLLNHIKVRNNSILAHGFSPIKEQDWQNIHHWLSECFIPMLLEETSAIGIKKMPEQLPSLYL